MAKSKKKSKKPQQKSAARPEKISLLKRLESRNAIAGFFVILFVFLVFLYSPAVFEGKESSGADVISNIGITHQWKQYYEETGERPLWNPYVFGGMPIYHRASPAVWSIDTLLDQSDFIIDWRVWYLWFGAIGMFLLTRYFGLAAAAGMLASLGFVLFPHYHALLVVGHFSKLRAIMWIPWVLVAFLFFLNRKDVLGMLLFALAYALQIRTQHYQIVFYTLLLLIFMGASTYIRMIVDKKKTQLLKFSGLLAASIVLVIVIIAQPFFVIRDYTPYSTRGGGAVDIQSAESTKDDKGVGFDYATNWSYTIGDFWDMLVPKFHGGTSQEVYTGNAVPRLRNRTIPAYWGGLPFTQSYEYVGIILILLALFGAVFQWQRKEVKALVFLSILALLMSLGNNFAVLYKLFYYYLPYFDKFRVPMMILTLLMFNVAVLAAYGLHYVLSGDIFNPENKRKFFVATGVISVFALIPLLFGSSFELSRPLDTQQFGAQVTELLKEARLDILRSYALRTVFCLAGGLFFLVMLKRKWLSPGSVAIGLILLVGLDLGHISKQFLSGKFTDPDRIEAQTYRKTELDTIIEQDTTLFRVSPPLQEITNDSRWCYFHQSIAGYNPAKLQVFQDIVDNNLFRSTDPALPFNLDVLSMLNVKYIAHAGDWQHSKLTKIASAQAAGLNLFRNDAVLSRTFFVGEVKVITDGVERLKFMNSSIFDPAEMALLEVELPESIQEPDTSFTRVSRFTPNEIMIDVYTDKQSLLVMSEIYYPNGWTAYLETGQELQIYKTNHLLRSVVVPPGQHTITVKFAPKAYRAGIYTSLAGMIIAYGGILFSAWRKAHGAERSAGH